jgi:hypothetical protein
MSSLARKSFLESMLRRDEISKSIVDCGDDLDDCLERFDVCFLSLSYSIALMYSFKYQLVAPMRVKYSKLEYEEARRKDVRFLESKAALYARSHQEVLRELKIHQWMMTDALLAMQRVSSTNLSVQWARH